jgi:hypothetical protein
MAEAKPVVAHIIYYGGERHKALCWGPPRLTTADTYEAYEIDRIIPLVALDEPAGLKADVK